MAKIPITERPRGLRALAGVQAAYFCVTGIWPLVAVDSFMLVTGPKADVWLVKALGLLITCIGVHLLRAARRGRIGEDTAVLAASSALSLAAIDIYYAGVLERIGAVYLIDAGVELCLFALWIALYPRDRARP